MGSPTDVGMSGFWGLILEPGKRYAKLVDVPFNITAAVLDTLSKEKEEDEILSVMLEVDGMEIIICNLSLKEGILQMPLSLRFEEGSRIAFYSTGVGSNIHLSGNVLGTKENYSALAMKTSGTFTQKKRKRSADDVKVESLKKIKSTEVSEAVQKIGFAKKVVVAEEKEEDDDDSGEEEEEEEDDDDSGEEEEDSEDDDDDEEEEEMDDEETEMNGVEEEEEPEPAPQPPPEAAKSKKKKKKKSKANKSLDTTITPQKEAIPQKSPKAEKSVDKTMATPKKDADAVNGKSQKQKKNENDIAKGSPQTPAKSPKVIKVVKMGGVTCEDLVVGNGTEAKLGKNVMVYYEGRLASNNKMFDKCESGKPFKFRLGAKDIIQGWNVAIAGMKVGGKRKFVCPPHLGYGKRGAPPDIPPQAALSFVVTLKNVV